MRVYSALTIISGVRKIRTVGIRISCELSLDHMAHAVHYAGRAFDEADGIVDQRAPTHAWVRSGVVVGKFYVPAVRKIGLG